MDNQFLAMIMAVGGWRVNNSFGRKNYRDVIELEYACETA